MKKLTLVFVLVVAVLAITGQMKNPGNPLVFAGKKMPTTPAIFPIPVCPPSCLR